MGKDTHYTEKFDIWALGAIYYELLVGIPPFIERTIEKFKHKLYEGSYEFPDNVHVSPEGIQFISRCLQYKEENRASIFELHGDPYVRNLKPKKGINGNNLAHSNTVMGSDDFDKMSSRGTELSTETGGMGSKQKTNNGRLNKMKTGGSVLEPEFRSSIIKGKNKDKVTPVKEEPKM